MVHRALQVLAAAVCFAVCVAHIPGSDGAAVETSATDAQPIEGLWSGGWGGAMRDGVVYQPVMAELVIQGNRAQWHNFPGVGGSAGTARFDAKAKRLRLAPAAEPGGQPAPKAVEYAVEIKGDQLTLTNPAVGSVSLVRQRAERNPLANVQLDLVMASGINSAGDLLVTEFGALSVGQAGATYYEPQERALKTKGATILQVQEAGLKKVTIDEARKVLRGPTVVAIAYRDESAPLPGLHELWKPAGPPPPESEAVARTLSRVLRPGTLVFVLSARQNVPQP